MHPNRKKVDDFIFDSKESSQVIDEEISSQEEFQIHSDLDCGIGSWIGSDWSNEKVYLKTTKSLIIVKVYFLILSL